MTERMTDEIEREEIELLLPWYATGQLDRADAARVESWLARHPHAARQLDLIREEQEHTVAVNEALGSPSRGAIDRLMVSLAGRRAGGWRGGSAILRRVAEFFEAPTARGLRWAAVAAALLVVVQAAAIGVLLLGERGGGYQVASGGTAADGVSALVVFTDQATAPAISGLLADFDASIVDGPKPGGVYKIRLQMEDPSQAAREALLRRLAERRDVVRTVLPSRD